MICSVALLTITTNQELMSLSKRKLSGYMFSLRSNYANLKKDRVLVDQFPEAIQFTPVAEIEYIVQSHTTPRPFGFRHHVDLSIAIVGSVAIRVWKPCSMSCVFQHLNRRVWSNALPSKLMSASRTYHHRETPVCSQSNQVRKIETDQFKLRLDTWLDLG